MSDFMKKNFQKGFVVIVVAALILSLGHVATAGTWENILKRGNIRIGVTTGFPPVGTKEKGVLKGFDIDIGRSLAAELFEDYKKVEFVEEAPAARIPNLLNDRVDVVIQAMSVTAGRAKQVWFTRPYFESWLAMLVSADSSYKTLDDLEDKKVCMMRNVFIEDLIHSAVPTAEVVATEYNADALFAVKAGRYDAFFADMPTVQYVMEKEPGEYRMLPGLFTPQNFAFAVKPEPNDMRWYLWLDTAVQELTRGTMFYTYYEPIYVKWLGVEPPSIFWLQDDVTLGKPRNPEVSVPAWVREK